KAAVVLDAHTGDPPGDVDLVLIPELSLFGQHAVAEQPPVRCADLLRRPLQIDAREARAILKPCARGAGTRERDLGRWDGRAERDRAVDEGTQADDASERHERAYMPSHACPPHHSGRAPRGHGPPRRSSTTVRTTAATMRVGSTTRRK